MANYAGHVPLFRKFVPEPFEYPSDTVKQVLRDGVIFDLNVSDYMQWFVFANLPDNAWRYALKRISVDGESAVVFDVGANIGAFSLKLARGCLNIGLPNVKIVSFEPNPFVFRKLQQNIARNLDLQLMVCPEPVALGASFGTAGMNFSFENTGSGRILDDSDSNIAVEMTTIDRFFADRDFRRLDFLKIDVEGYEPFVIDGGLHVIKEYRPDIFIEITPQWFSDRGRSAQELYDGLCSIGYQLHFDDGNRLVPLEKLQGFKAQFNVLALCGKYL
jgi:FkbM family methyltransferase